MDFHHNQEQSIKIARILVETMRAQDTSHYPPYWDNNTVYWETFTGWNNPAETQRALSELTIDCTLTLAIKQALNGHLLPLRVTVKTCPCAHGGAKFADWSIADLKAWLLRAREERYIAGKAITEETRRAINGRLATEAVELLTYKLHREVNRRDDLTSSQLGQIADRISSIYETINTMKNDR